MPKTLVAPKVIEGSWAEVSEQAKQFADHQVRLIILPLDKPASNETTSDSKIPGLVPPKIGSGTFQEIVQLMADGISFSEEESLLEPVLENRAMRRSLLKENEVE